MFKHIVGAIVSLMVFVVSAGLLVSGDYRPRVVLSLLASDLYQGREAELMELAEANRIDLTVTWVNARRMRTAIRMGIYTDAIWPASSLWIEGADLLHVTPVMSDPVGLAVAQPIAEGLGWTGRTDLTVDEVFEAARSGAFTLTLPSPSQTDIGALAYLGAMQAAWGSEPLTTEALASPGLRDALRGMLAQVDRAPAEANWLRLPAAAGRMQAVFATGAQVSAYNSVSDVPLILIRPADMQIVADAPMAFVPGHDAAQEAAFLTLRDALAGPADPVALPPLDVALEALDLYQTTLRRPSLTAWLVDASGEGADWAKGALQGQFNPEQLAVAGTQATARDVSIVIPFAENIGAPIVVSGNDPTDMAHARRQIASLAAQPGARDLWYALYEGFEAMTPYQQGHTLGDHLPAIIVMSRGGSIPDTREALFAHLAQVPFSRQVPVQGLWAEGTPPPALVEITTVTGGQLIDGTVATTRIDALNAARAGN
ncbi:substrate-binding domain-containing protein [Tropicibacter alexandrii]|uniref:substrate-binding domain-containing protein n=1 Tax=Tropicibacter alexandrii TaxID=2267683 RepID=UPI001008C0C9|nr:substrate-binding domain-containing protein [Tropicibacter alexandrii]